MYRVAVCDDEGEQAEALQAAVAAWSRARGIPCNAQAFPSGESLWFAWQGGAFDILLLDVEMGKTSGIELDKSLRAAGSRAEIVFITSHFEFAGEGYEVDALHYLLKPVSREKLFQVLDKAAARLSQEPPSLVITSGGERVKLYAPDILYVESFRMILSSTPGQGSIR
ncbi:MAG: response regulator transcription factor [Acutalibacter sp.]|jgi:DNA-binding LytR/AlgR family response regulator|nr:response regulator transcription factor [Acutalibacter sp.]